MALLKMGAIVTQVSGKVGGQTFGNGQAGQYLKNTGSYVNKLTPLRSVSNSKLASLANSWRSLSSSDKSSWAAAAPNFPYVNRLGETKQYSGYNLYMKFNGNRAIWGAAPVATAPVPFVFNEFAIDEFSIDNNSMYIALTFGYVGYTYVLFASNPSSAGSSFNEKGLRFMQAVDGIGDGVEFDFEPEYQALFGQQQVGTRIFFRIYQYETATGIKSGFYINVNTVVVQV